MKELAFKRRSHGEQKLNVLVTGGAGYIGTLLVGTLLNEGHRVTIVDNFLFGCEPVLAILDQPELTIIRTDIREADLSFLRDQDAIFHLAAISGIPGCKHSPDSAVRINQIATERIVRQLSADQLLIFASTTSLYGTGGEISTEETAITPDSIYAETKLEAEKIVMERENSISLRFATVFGVSPRMRQGLLVNDFVYKAIHEGVIVTYQGKAKRTFMHIRDTVRGYVFALRNWSEMRGQVFNIGSERLNYSKLDVANVIREFVDFDIVETDFAYTAADSRDFYVSFDKVKGHGFDCRFTLQDGVRDLMKLYRFYDPFAFTKPI